MNLPYKFLQNLPIGKDLFEGKSQEKIAEIVSTILENENFQIIGIDGGWGTGKSNLVKIIENKLDTKGCKFFIYDVWGHQEDDQRKAILVELTEFISNKNRNLISDKHKWTKKLTLLLSKERNTTTINTPYLSIGFIFSLFSIIYVPTINVFKDTVVDFFGITQLFWKFVLVTLPFLLLLGIYFWNFIKNCCNKVGFLKSFEFAAQETFQIYNNKQKQETKTETISENEPSVRDFRDWMKEIDTDLRSNNKKLVIVFDNFDRLPKKYIQSIWASIHIFFADEKYSNIKVIIPFDREHIKNAFCELNGSEKKSHEDIDQHQIDFAHDYINKTFDLVYRISPPIMSDWKIFFKNCWNEAHQNSINEIEYLKVEQIYETYAKLITPREIIAFINEIIAIKLLHNDIPERYIGLFIINKDVILKDCLKAIIEPDFIKGLSYLYKDDEDFQKYITALSYQIDSENALEVIYRKKLKDSIINNEAELFSRIAKTTVFNKLILSVIQEIDDYNNPIYLLNSLNNDVNLTVSERQNIWDDIYLKIKNQKLQGFDLNESSKILIIQISKKYKSEWIARIILHLYNYPDFNHIKFIQIVDDLINLSKEKSFELDIFDLLSVKDIQPDFFMSVVKLKKEAFDNYKFRVSEIDLDKYLSNLGIDNLVDIEFIRYLKPTFKFKKFKQSIKEQITVYKSDRDSLKILFDALKFVSESEIEILLDDIDVYTLFSQSSNTEEFYYDLVAMRLIKGVKFHPSYSSIFDTILNQEDDTLAKKVSERILNYIQYGDLLLHSLTFTNNLMKSVVRYIIIDEELDKKADIETLLKSFDKICLMNDLDPQVFIYELDRWEIPNFNNSFIKVISNYYFKEALKNDTDLAKESISALKNYFDNLIEAEWKEIFNNLKGKEYELIYAIGYSQWNSYSLEALKDVLLSQSHSDKIINGEKFTQLIISFKNKEIDLTNTFKNIRDELISRRNINVDLFLFFGSWLFDYAKLEEKASDVLRTILISDLLDNDECLKIIFNYSSIIKLLLESSSSSESSDFKEAIKDRFENEKIKELAKLLGIRKRKDKEEIKVEEE